ncbi:MAG: AAA family ATPase [Promethearchaeota archaeon]
MSKHLETPWVEKYRPKRFDEIVSQNIAISNIKKFIKSKEMPHMIFVGPAGTGKTTTALIIAREMIGKEDLYSSLLELNASDTVRMEYVRSVIKNFINQNISTTRNGIKFILLDEADNIPGQVQQALRRMMEQAANNVKFILMCNYINRIIDPIISRCAVFRFVNLPKEQVIERLKFISEKENLKIPEDKKELFYETLYFISAGDLRKAINALQMSVALDLIQDLNINEILNISGFMTKNTVQQLISAFQEKNLTRIQEILLSLTNLDSRNILRQIVALLVKLKGIEDTYLARLRAFIGNIDYRIGQGSDERLQLMALFAEIMLNMKN